MAAKFVDVLVPVALDQTYSYRVPAEFDLAAGDIVAVPLGAREAIGVVWAEDVTIRPGLHNRMKDVELKLEYPPLKPDLRTFVDWVSGYTLSARGMVLRMCLRMGENLGAAREKVGVRLSGPAPKRMTAARARVLQLLADGLVRTKSEVAHEAGVSAGVINGLIDEAALETLILPPEPVARQPDPEHAVPELTDAQRSAADALRSTVVKGGFSVTLVDGVTGSGKTEVYFEAVAEAIRRKKTDSDPDAGDRADRAVSRSLCGAVRRAPGGMAFGAGAAQARPHLVGGRGGQCVRGGRGPFRFVSAVPGPRTDHRR
jgi:primosomal protein N' (replication factor Y)